MGPSLNQARGSHGCIKILNPNGNRPTVIIAGGEDSTDFVDSVEAWDLYNDEIIEFSNPAQMMPGTIHKPRGQIWTKIRPKLT